MSIATQIKNELNLPTFVVEGYLQDLTDEQLFIRPPRESEPYRSSHR